MVFLVIFGDVNQRRPLRRGDCFLAIIFTARRAAAQETGETVLHIFKFPEGVPVG